MSWCLRTRVRLVLICVGISIISMVFLTGWALSANATPQAPGVELEPGYTQQADAGQNVSYYHTLTNTGTTTDTFLLTVSSIQGWPVELLAEDCSSGTTLLPIQVGSQMTASFHLSLTVPTDVGGVTEITYITATSQLSPTVQDTATDRTIVYDYIYLPFVAKRWPPLPPYAPTLYDIDNHDCNSYYTVNWIEEPEPLADIYLLEEAVCTYFCDDFLNPTVAYSGTNNSWSVPVPGRTSGTYLYRVRGQNTVGYGEYSDIEAVTVVPEPTSAFASVVAQLDTSGKLSNSLMDEFEWTFHDGCISYWPEEFYNHRSGDCKDYATFSSYVLAQHGYYAEVVSFTWYGQDGTRYGHVVVIYQGEDGVLRYMSNGEIMERVTSVSDLLEKERQRLNASSIGHYLVLPPGTATVCTH